MKGLRLMLKDLNSHWRRGNVRLEINMKMSLVKVLRITESFTQSIKFSDTISYRLLESRYLS